MKLNGLNIIGHSMATDVVVIYLLNVIMGLKEDDSPAPYVTDWTELCARGRP
jgi:hypothetical protein